MTERVDGFPVRMSVAGENGSTYDMLNEMELEYTLKDYEKLERLLRKYDSMKKKE